MTSSEYSINFDVPPEVTKEDVAAKLEEFGGNWSKVFDYYENILEEYRKSLRQRRWYMAECRVCSFDGRLKMPFADIEERNEWAREHSHLVNEDEELKKELGLEKHNVKIWEEWK